MFWFAPGGRVECFFPPFDWLAKGEGRKGLRANFTENTGSFVYGLGKKINHSS